MCLLLIVFIFFFFFFDLRLLHSISSTNRPNLVPLSFPLFSALSAKRCFSLSPHTSAQIEAQAHHPCNCLHSQASSGYASYAKSRPIWNISSSTPHSEPYRTSHPRLPFFLSFVLSFLPPSVAAPSSDILDELGICRSQYGRRAAHVQGGRPAFGRS